MRIKGHPEKRLNSESWSSFRRRILGDNISDSKSEQSISGDRKQNSCGDQASGDAAWNCQNRKLIISHGPVTDEPKPQAEEGRKQSKQSVVMKRSSEIKM